MKLLMKMSGSLFSLVTSERKCGLTLFVLMIFPMMVGTLSAQRMIAHRGTVKDAYNFWFYVPPVIAPPDSAVVPPLVIDSIRGEEGDLMEAMVRKPLVIFLHGASLRGNNLSQVRRYGTLDALSKGLNLDAYVLAPQHPTGGWQPDRIDRLVDWALERYAIDSTRIYVLGMSMGGFGTIDYAAASPHRVAAGLALCGGDTQKTNHKNLLKVPLCILHGTEDHQVPWESSQRVVDSMRAVGDTTRLIYRLLPGQNHSMLSHYFYFKSVYDWLFLHSTTDKWRPVRRRYGFIGQLAQKHPSPFEKSDKKIQIKQGE